MKRYKITLERDVKSKLPTCSITKDQIIELMRILEVSPKCEGFVLYLEVIK